MALGSCVELLDLVLAVQDAVLPAGMDAHQLPLALPGNIPRHPPAARLYGLTHLTPAPTPPDGDSTSSGDSCCPCCGRTHVHAWCCVSCSSALVDCLHSQPSALVSRKQQADSSPALCAYSQH